MTICAGVKMPNRGSAQTVVPISPTDKGSDVDRPNQLESAGESILRLLEKAASVAEENTRRGLVMAEKLANQLRAAEDRIAELEAEVVAHRNQADRAEQWLHKVYTEIEGRFLRQNGGRRVAR
jgi:hypothetical protein